MQERPFAPEPSRNAPSTQAEGAVPCEGKCLRPEFAGYKSRGKTLPEKSLDVFRLAQGHLPVDASGIMTSEKGAGGTGRNHRKSWHQSGQGS